MTDEERITALRAFGYGEREARFLLIAALHSGYFVRRQFLSFTSGCKGRCDSEFVARLRGRQHCRETVFRGNRAVYRLCSKPFFAALGEPDNRNRREKQPQTIKNRLMALDFVLANPGHEYLATERGKIEYFHLSLGIPMEVLPARLYRSRNGQAVTIRYFVDKFPIFLAPADVSAPAGARRVVHFCYVDEGLGSADGLETHLAHYRPLFEALGEYRVVYVGANRGVFPRAKSAFLASQLGRGMSRPTSDSPETQQVIRYFEARKKYEAKDFSGFDTARLIRYREEKRLFAGDHFESLYRQWLAGENATPGTGSLRSMDCATSCGGSFLTYEVSYDYGLFGTLQGRTDGAGIPCGGGTD